MVVPWNGFELADLLNMAGVQSGAKYVSFETALRPDEMPGVAYNVLDWPYVEGLRLDEAMHPLTIMATGIYGKDIPKQNGAPLRLVRGNMATSRSNPWCGSPSRTLSPQPVGTRRMQGSTASIVM